jgi:outer membrane protein assembly factor BamB
MPLARCLIISSFVIAFVASPLPAQDWSRFRGPDGLGVSPAKGLPLTWSQKENIVWKTPLPGAGTSSPVIVGDKIYLICFSGYNVPGKDRGEMEDLKLHLLCLARDAGTILWTTDIAPKLPEQPTMSRDNHGYASSTPIVEGDRIYAFFGKSGAFAFDLKGTQLWHADVGSNLNEWGSAASPVFFGDVVIINASVESQSLVGLDKKTGKEIWRARGINEAWNTPALVPLPGGKTELVVGIPRKVLAFDPATGQQLWSCATDIGWYIVPSPVFHDGIVWSIGGRSGIVGIAVRAGGRGDVTKTHRLWTSKYGSNVSSPIFHDGHLYWMNDSSAIAYCADAMSGQLVYEERIPRGDQVYASPVLADGRIHYTSRTGRTYVLPAAPKYELLATNDLSDRSRFNAAPAVSGSQMFFRSDAFLYCVGKK